MRALIYLATIFLPWGIRRRVLCAAFGYQLHPTSRIGLAWVAPAHLVMEAHSKIGTGTVCKGLNLVHLKPYAEICRLNWITGVPAGHKTHFAHQENRRPELVVGEHSAITNRHLIDCTNAVTIGAFTTVAGFRSQILTHSIDLEECRQSSAPITIGDYCFVGTDCVLLGGSSLPDYSVLGAKSLLNRKYDEPFRLYAGTPAKVAKILPKESGYFNRAVGFVN